MTSPNHQRQRKRGAIEILEEAISLLRLAPAAAVLAYLTGMVPFIVGLLFFLVDMTHSPFAFEHLGEASLGVALLYVWKSVWQAVFTASLYRALSPGPVRDGGWWKTVSIQSAVQPAGLLIQPVALVTILSLPWVVPFFRNAALFAGLGARDPIRTAARQAALWTRQTACILLILLLGGLLLFVNVLALIVMLPQLARSFLGIEGELARAGALGLLNVTTLSVAAALTWMALDPILDAVYVLRCFYGESVTSGEDLRAAFRRSVAAAGLVFVVLSLAPRAAAQDAAPQASQQASQQAQAVDAHRLDSSIQEVIHRREFTWRSPMPAGNEPTGRWVSWYRALVRTVRDVVDWVVKRILDWLKGPSDSDGLSKGSAVTRRQLEVLIAIAVALIVAAGAFYFHRTRRPATIATAVTEAIPAIDLADESVTADQLPEDSWWKMAEDLQSKGEHRLAMRALYLAGINHLSSRGLVSIRRWKTGLEYRSELDRRARSTPEIAPVFARNVSVFEQSWYGRHPADQADVDTLVAGIRQMRSNERQG